MRLAISGAAKNRAQTCDKFTHSEGLYKIVVCAEFQRPNPVVLVSQCCEHQNGYASILSQAPQELERIHLCLSLTLGLTLRHHQIQDQEIAGAPGETSESGCSVR